MGRPPTHRTASEERAFEEHSRRRKADNQRAYMARRRAEESSTQSSSRDVKSRLADRADESTHDMAETPNNWALERAVLLSSSFHTQNLESNATHPAYPTDTIRAASRPCNRPILPIGNAIPITASPTEVNPGRANFPYSSLQCECDWCQQHFQQPDRQCLW
ncbi:hypothetical protein K461DRAFT_93061 [Myriangium duriaei CBS 260.36]|uniref:Uncharacterized protein n=1 Tax=Myriangium duriaei CBS 260.36 TaxID=1168546 RepID=A0A9P4MR53_9PEZI|nr:hypothetical protein K461DRAFT_93061 [Myriangium duriaei CBS 260.36]